MSLVDLALGLLLLLGLFWGWRTGTVGTVLTVAGFWAGLTLAALLIGAVVPAISSPAFRAFFTLAALLGVGLVLGICGRLVGSWSNALLRRVHLGLIDSLVGAFLAALGLLLSAWLVGSLLAQSRFSTVSTAIQNSAVMQTVDRVHSPVPSLFSRVQTFLQEEKLPHRFRRVDTHLGRSGPRPILGRSAGHRLGGGRFDGQGPGHGLREEQEGSSFVVAPGPLATNAHVVAGESSTQVIVNGLSYAAVPVYFNAEYDLALLRTSAPLGPPVHLDGEVVPRGTKAAVVGYPEMGSLTVPRRRWPASSTPPRRPSRHRRGGARHLPTRRQRRAWQLGQPGGHVQRVGGWDGVLPLDGAGGGGLRPHLTRDPLSHHGRGEPHHPGEHRGLRGRLSPPGPMDQ